VRTLRPFVFPLLFSPLLLHMLFCGPFHLDLSRPLVMGIINVTPDSFSDGGLHLRHDAALAHAHQLIAEGAAMLDIGGESTRPGAMPVGVQQELDRVLPLIEALRGAPVPLSIDTHKPEVMRAALAAGVSMVNDINALQQPGALQALAASDAAVCLMHKQGDPQTMQQQPHYADVVSEVKEFLRARIAAAQAAGIARERMVIDPGFGFGKSLVHNLDLLRSLADFEGMGVPLLAGLSRKSMLGAITGQDVEHRLPASVAAALLAVQRGAKIVRVHDVRATVDALKILDAVNENHTPQRHRDTETQSKSDK
jgi:dihydropteroate synthase